MIYQEYEFTLSNGTILRGSNSYETMDEAVDFIAQYAYGNDDKVLIIDDKDARPTFVLRKNIVSLKIVRTEKEEDEGGN